MPIIGSPLFIVGSPKWLIEQCKAGVIGSMPVLKPSLPLSTTPPKKINSLRWHCGVYGTTFAWPHTPLD